MGEILGASEVSFFGSAIRLVSEALNFVYEIGLLRVEPLSIGLLEIALGDANIFGDAALIIRFLGFRELRRDLRSSGTRAVSSADDGSGSGAGLCGFGAGFDSGVIIGGRCAGRIPHIGWGRLSCNRRHSGRIRSNR